MHIKSIKISQAMSLVYKLSKDEMRRLSPVPTTEQYWTHMYSVYKNMIIHNIVDDNYLIAGVLHDIFEDTKYTQEECILDYGIHVANLVRFVTKKNEEENIFLSISKIEDPYYKKGAVLIKLFDRLDNIFGATFLDDPKKLKNYLNESNEFLLPLLKECSEEYARLLINTMDYFLKMD